MPTISRMGRPTKNTIGPMMLFLPIMGVSLPDTARTTDAAITGSLLHALFSRRYRPARRPVITSLN
jgi:hypothetical protein